MHALEQQLFALELIVTVRLAMDTPEMRRVLAEVVGRDVAECDEIEAAIRRRALEIIRSADAPNLV